MSVLFVVADAVCSNCVRKRHRGLRSMMKFVDSIMKREISMRNGKSLRVEIELNLNGTVTVYVMEFLELGLVLNVKQDNWN